MSKENAVKFLREYRSNAEAKKLLEQSPKPGSEEELISLIVEAAGKLGVRFTEKEAAEANRELLEEQKARTDALSSDLQALDDDEVSQVAGGGNKNESCSEDYMRVTSCWSENYCYGIVNRSPSGRKDVPCSFDYNCFNLLYEEKCEQNFFYVES